jgi:DNA-binding HxlR family transcriptional regulator
MVTRRRQPLCPELCPSFHKASELIGRRWTGAIIFVLLRVRCRFAVLRDAIPDITDRMLSERLQELEAEGLLVRTVVPESPVRVEYALTKKGRALSKAIGAITAWAHRWVASEAPRHGGARRAAAARRVPTSTARARRASSERRSVAPRRVRRRPSPRRGTS